VPVSPIKKAAKRPLTEITNLGSVDDAPIKLQRVRQLSRKTKEAAAAAEPPRLEVFDKEMREGAGGEWEEGPAKDTGPEKPITAGV
jgi:hypothetical protein